ncbi:MarR family winged helix-turn-helix transcriptional regulator [Ottowia sp.]|uniref:MarR family winged helix-turn-helix transcriptional regulator n=1 Tax=Ottowia sp. TaxID=1898956 RepID=UPI0039E45DAC
MFDHCLYFNTSALARRLEREWAEAFRPFGLAPPQGFVLRAVLQRPGILPSELADELAISRPTATRALDGLAAKGLVTRQAAEQDTRQVAVYPTADALAIGAALNEASGKVTRRLKKMLGEPVFDTLVKDVRGVRSALN